MDMKKIEDALQAASSLMVVEVWCPPEHKFEQEQRYKAREAVNRMCIDALNELRGFNAAGQAVGEPRAD